MNIQNLTLVKFLKSRIFLRNFVLAIVIAFVLIRGTFLLLNLYTRHNSEISVPDFTGMSFEEVKQILSDKKLRFEITDSIYTKKVPKGAVVEQNPPPDFNVKKNRRIFLTLNAYGDELVEMPDLLEVSLVQAKADLETNGLRLGKLKYVEHQARNLILHQEFNGKEITKGVKIQKGSAIDLVLGKGEDEIKLTIPDVGGNMRDVAFRRITDACLNVGLLYYDETVKTEEDKAKSFVWKQSPQPRKNAEIELGTTVDLWLTTDKIESVSHQYDPELDSLEADQ